MDTPLERKLIEQVMPGLYRIEIPLPRNPLKYLNAYLITSDERNLIIDTGMNRPECRQALESALVELEVDLSKTDIFLTHYHADHCGQTAWLKTGTSRAFCSSSEAEVVNQMNFFSKHWQTLREYARIHGFPLTELDSAVNNHPGRLYSPTEVTEFIDVHENDEFSVGQYRFICIATPGHTPDHMCLYEPRHKILLSGDHILGDITPNISQWYDDSHDLTRYFASLDKVSKLSVNLVLPGHRRVFNNLNKRIDELQAHHRSRLDEVVKIMSTGLYSSYEVARRMTWDMRGTWDQFAVQQRWFATGEAIAHLMYLVDQGQLVTVKTGDAIKFCVRP